MKDFKVFSLTQILTKAHVKTVQHDLSKLYQSLKITFQVEKFQIGPILIRPGLETTITIKGTIGSVFSQANVHLMQLINR
jgi:hypothetical protein